MSSQTYHAIVQGLSERRRRKTLILTDVTPTAGGELPTHHRTWVSPGTWGHLATAGSCITFDAEVSTSTGLLIYITRVYDSEGRRLDEDKPGQRQQLIRRYQKGISMTDLGRERDVSRQRISVLLRDAWLETHGTVPPRLQPTEHEAALRQQIASLHLNGSSRKHIASLLGINTRRVAAIIAAEGLPERICAACRKPATNRMKYCEPCREQVHQAQLRVRAANMRARRRRLKDTGLCHDCRQPTGDGHTQCHNCRAIKSALVHNRRQGHHGIPPP